MVFQAKLYVNDFLKYFWFILECPNGQEALLDDYSKSGYIVVMINGKITIGILGGIGSGKSTVAGVFSANGCAVINADKIAHDVLEEDGTKKQICEAFGEGVFEGESVDRKKLGEVAFESEGNWARINGIIHPKVLAEIDKLIDVYSRDKSVRAIVLDVPLLVEVGLEKKCDKLIFVECSPEIKVARAEKNGLSEENLKKRENFQFSLDKKAQLAHYVVHNNSDLGKVTDQVIQFLSTIIFIQDTTFEQK